MSLPRFFLPDSRDLREGLQLSLEPTQARHVSVLRLKPGDPLEVVMPAGGWRADLVEVGRERAVARLVAPMAEEREAPIPIQVWLPITAQLSLVDEMLPPLVELGASLLQPVVYARSEYDARKTLARLDRWQRILLGACEQSHRTRLPELREPVLFAALLSVALPQKWVAFEYRTDQANPALQQAAIACTSGPEGGITDEEFQALRGAGWQPVSLGLGILRAVTAPVALLGAIQHQLGR
jgi:16S rRNA (uracil1498-N3)-methyltransferase